MADFAEPNLYQLAGAGVEVSYSTSSFDGQPRFGFREAGRSLDFTGEEIRARATDLGTEVTVPTEVVEDLRTVTLTLVLPGINMGDLPEVEFATVAVETTEGTTIGGPRLIVGPLQTYRVIELAGTARTVDF